MNSSEDVSEDMQGLRHQALGAQLLQAITAQGLPLLYLSPLSVDGQPARGGVPLLFPQFAQFGPGRKHGFARHQRWTLERAEPQALSYGLEVLPGQLDGWPYAARLRLLATLNNEALNLQWWVENTGQTGFEWGGGLHPYWAVSSLETCELLGLEATPGLDNLSGQPLPPQAEPWRFGPEGMEYLFEGLPSLQLRTPTHTLHLQGSGFTQWMVWNPGLEGGRGLADLPDQDALRFICIEPVCARPMQWLAPGAGFEGSLQVRWECTSRARLRGA